MIVLLIPGKPICLILTYGALGSLFMPFLTLLGLLNGKCVPKEWANKLHNNITLGICSLLFGSLGIQQLIKSISPIRRMYRRSTANGTPTRWRTGAPRGRVRACDSA